jgi:hypothetical protein
MNDRAETAPFSGIRPYRRRSEMYRWLREHHGHVAELLAATEPSWREVAERLGRAGVRNTKGALPSADSIRRVWRVVCRDVAGAHTRPIREGRLPPSRIPSGTQPTETERPKAPPPAPPSDRPWAVSVPSVPWRKQGTEAPPPVAVSGGGAEMLARVKRTLARKNDDNAKGS